MRIYLTSKYVRQKLIELQGEINPPLQLRLQQLSASIDRSGGQKINEAIDVLNRAINQLDLKDIYRTLHLTAAECTFFSSSHGISSRYTTF